MRRPLAFLALAALFLFGVGGALALGETTDTVVACATATAPGTTVPGATLTGTTTPDHVIGDNGVALETIPGVTIPDQSVPAVTVPASVASQCETVTYTIPTSTVTTTVSGTGTTSTTGTTTTAPTSTTTTTTTSTTTTTAPPATPQPVGNPGTWRLIFDDEFNGSTLDLTKWQPNWFGQTDASITRGVDWGSGIVNCEDPGMVSEGNGLLTINAQQSACTTWDAYNYAYRYGMITTRADWSFTYGHAETRIFLPADATGNPANWSGFWTNGYSWPSTGEDDIAEINNGSPHRVCFNYHASFGQSGQTCPAGTYAGGWHTFGADWEPGIISWFYDGVKVGQFASANVAAAPNYLLLTGELRSTNIVLKPIQADYVRVWQH